MGRTTLLIAVPVTEMPSANAQRMNFLSVRSPLAIEATVALAGCRRRGRVRRPVSTMPALHDWAYGMRLHNQRPRRSPTMPNPQNAILTNLTKYQWYTHLSRTEGADLGVIKQAIIDARNAGSDVGMIVPINVCILFGPSLLAELTDDMPNDFQPYPGYQSPDGKV